MSTLRHRVSKKGGWKKKEEEEEERKEESSRHKRRSRNRKETKANTEKGWIKEDKDSGDL